MTDHSMIKKIQSELSHLIARLGPAPTAPRPVDEACDIYSEIRFARDRRALALASVCYWCGFQPGEALANEASWS